LREYASALVAGAPNDLTIRVNFLLEGTESSMIVYNSVKSLVEVIKILLELIDMGLISHLESILDAFLDCGLDMSTWSLQYLCPLRDTYPRDNESIYGLPGIILLASWVYLSLYRSLLEIDFPFHYDLHLELLAPSIIVVFSNDLELELELSLFLR